MSEKAPTVRGRVRVATLFDLGSIRRYAHVLSGEGLLLTRESSNPVDSNAIIVSTEVGPVGYLERAAAAQIAPWIDKGWVYMCTCIKTADIRVNHRTRKKQVHRDSLLVRCVPIAPIALSKVARRTRQLEDAE